METWFGMTVRVSLNILTTLDNPSTDNLITEKLTSLENSSTHNLTTNLELISTSTLVISPDNNWIFTGLLIEDASSGSGNKLVGHTEVLKTSNSTGILGGWLLALLKSGAKDNVCKMKSGQHVHAGTLMMARVAFSPFSPTSKG